MCICVCAHGWVLVYVYLCMSVCVCVYTCLRVFVRVRVFTSCIRVHIRAEEVQRFAEVLAAWQREATLEVNQATNTSARMSFTQQSITHKYHQLNTRLIYNLNFVTNLSSSSSLTSRHVQHKRHKSRVVCLLEQERSPPFRALRKHA